MPRIEATFQRLPPLGVGRWASLRRLATAYKLTDWPGSVYQAHIGATTAACTGSICTRLASRGRSGSSREPYGARVQERPTRPRVSWGGSPQPSIARFGRVAYAMPMQVTTWVLLARTRHGCPGGHEGSSGGSDLGGKQAWRPERQGIAENPPEIPRRAEVAARSIVVSRPVLGPRGRPMMRGKQRAHAPRMPPGEGRKHPGKDSRR
jgi:hypothetical protein